MTEDTSPENLRKFLESDDPALIRMGLSMTKGAGVPDEMLGEILWMYIFHDDKTIRAAAKSTFIKLAPEDAKQAVKENWKASYLKHGRWTKSGHIDSPLGILGKALCHTSVSLVGPLIRALGDDDENPYGEYELDVRASAAGVLGRIGDTQAVVPLIKALSHDAWWVRRSATETLGEIGNERAVGPLIKALGDANDYVRASAAVALGKISDARAVEPLIALLEDEDKWVRDAAKDALKKLGHEVE